MEIINVYVKGQDIYCDRQRLVSDTENIYHCVYHFEGDEWEGADRWAVFKGNEQPFQRHLVNDECDLVNSSVSDVGYVCLGAYGVKGDKRYPTIYTPSILIQLGAREGIEPPPPTPSQWEEIITALSQKANTTYVDEEIARVDTDIENLGNSVSSLESAVEELDKNKVEKEEGKGLSSNDFTDEEKEKLDSLNPEELGKVDDVLVNGTSVLGTDKKARVVVPTKTSEITNDSNYQNASQVESAITSKGYQTAQQVEDRIVAKGYATEEYVDSDINDLQSQIDSLVSKSDVVDVVGTYAELLAYDTSKLNNNDVVKVLDDSTHQNARSYYRWIIVSSVGSWNYVGSENVGYTKSQVDAYLNQKVDKVEGYSLVSDTQIAQIETNRNDISSLDTNKADKSTTYTKTEVDSALILKANQSTTYTKTETDSAISNHHDNTKEDVSNKVTSIDEESTDIEYPSAKAVYDLVDEKVQVVNIEVGVNKSSLGTATGGGIVPKGTSTTITATPSSVASQFIRWEKEDGTTLSEENPYTFVVDDNYKIKAIFETGVKIVSWADGSDEDLADMIEAADLGYIDLKNYWSVGDERIVHVGYVPAYSNKVSEMSARNISFKLADSVCDGFTDDNGNKPNFMIFAFSSVTVGVFKDLSAFGNRDNSAPQKWFDMFYEALPDGFKNILKKMHFKLVSFNEGSHTPVLMDEEHYVSLPPCKCLNGASNMPLESALYNQWEIFPDDASRVRGNWWMSNTFSEFPSWAAEPIGVCRISNNGGTGYDALTTSLTIYPMMCI